ncbi:shikimate 5-dehydrogenase [Naasia sp. SYSU D00057]|uniref:shikimate 5-dehydrogenase n=1 Tax=Naasia sp. SYSU D00057 TaxID=2817380 RepID=UPI0027DBE401|nr:shikimate 5-dehydrogenase [Naasia sp. SYSU D00057]
MPILDKDMTLCISLAARPSNLGTRFHNFLYDELGLPFVYKAFAPTDIEQAIAGVRGLGIRGCSVSMPYKEAVIPLVDELTPSADRIRSVNTIVNHDGRLIAHNTDYLAVRALLEESPLRGTGSVLLRGSGGMAKAVLAAVRDLGFEDVTLLARSEERGRPLADQYGAAWTADATSSADLLINATPIGMAGGAHADELAFPEEAVSAASTVFDVVAVPATTPLLALAERLGKDTITGVTVTGLQAAEQFELYTGVRPTPEAIERATAFSRAG